MIPSLPGRAKALQKQSLYEFLLTVIEVSDILKEIQPRQRKAWLLRVIEEIYLNQDGKCALCGRNLELGVHEVDHVIPFSYGGGNERGNLQLTCITCNRKKGVKVNPLDLLNYLEDRVQNL